MTPFLQRPKKSKLSGWQILTRKNFLDGALKSFLWQIHCFGDIYINTFLQEFMYRNWFICFQIIWKVSKPSKMFPDHPKSFQIIRKVSRPSRKFPDHLEICAFLHVFNDGFHSNAKKLSGRAKTFGVVMPPWDMGFSVSAFLGARYLMLGAKFWLVLNINNAVPFYILVPNFNNLVLDI